METWHYQIQEFDDKGQKYYQMIEVYSRGLRTLAGHIPMGETPEELIRELEIMLSDARKYPVMKVEE